MRHPHEAAAQHGSVPRAAILVALLSLTLIAFGGVAGNRFINYDDPDYLTANEVVQQGLTARGVAWAFSTTQGSYWHPLTWLSHLLVVELFGIAPGPHHLTNLALHAANAALLFLALRLMTGALWRSALVAALFAVHPLLVESVAWATERKDVLSMVFALAALLSYVRAARRGRVREAASLPIFLLLALLAKPMPVTLPFLLLLLDWWPLGRWTPGKAPPDAGSSGGSRLPLARFIPPGRLWLEKVPLLLLAAVVSAITLAAQRLGTATAFGNSLPLGRRLANAVLGYGFYLRKAVWPVDLAVFYPYPVAMPPLWLWCGWLAVVLALTVFVLRGARRRPSLAVGWLWFLGALAPMIGIVHVGYQAWADRHAYLPIVGLFLAGAWALGALVKQHPATRRPVVVATGAAVLALAGLTRAQVVRWHDSGTLYRHAIAVTSGNWLAWNLLGNAFAEGGDLQQAIAAYRTASGLSHEQGVGATIVDFNLAAALQAQGKTPEAAAAYRHVIRIDPADRDALNNLGSIALADGNPGEAVELYRRALASDPRFAVGHYNLGRALAAQDDLEGAARHLREALALGPQDADAAALLREVLTREAARAPRQERQR